MAEKNYGGWGSSVKSRKYLYGLASLRVSRDGTVMVKLSKDEKARPPRMTDTTFEIPKENVKTRNPVKAGDWFVCVSEKGDTLVSVSPPQDNRYTLKFAEFPHAADSLPEPRVNEGGPRTWVDKKTGLTKKAVFDDSLDFSAVVEVVGGPYAGSTGRMTVPYAIIGDDKTGYAKLFGSQSQVEKCGTFLAVAGATDPVPFSDNILPDLEAILKEAAENGHVFTGKVNAGRVYDLEPIMEAPKSKAKSKAAPKTKTAPKSKADPVEAAPKMSKAELLKALEKLQSKGSKSKKS